MVLNRLLQSCMYLWSYKHSFSPVSYGWPYFFWFRLFYEKDATFVFGSHCSLRGMLCSTPWLEFLSMPEERKRANQYASSLWFNDNEIFSGFWIRLFSVVY